MTEKKTSRFRKIEATIVRWLVAAPWYVFVFFFRIFYGFRLENRKRIPKEGPFILILKEPGIIGLFTTGYTSITIITPMILKDPPTPAISFMQDLLFHMPYFSKLRDINERYGWQLDVRALIPHGGGGPIALGLLDALHILRDRGIVVMNPEGDMRWDGLPMTIGKGAAWMGLHSAAPIVPALCTIGAYEIWPVWRLRPFPRGRVSVRVGEPFKVSETPLEKITDEDLDAATERIQKIYNELTYGEGGVEAWVGPILHSGKTIEEPPSLQPPENLLTREKWKHDPSEVSVAMKGVSGLLWRCPICFTNDSLFHRRPLFRTNTVKCQACETVWNLSAKAGNDFRMRIVAGQPEWIGLDMPLSTWYAKMKEDFRPVPIQTAGIDLMDDEEVYLEAAYANLEPHAPNELFSGWSEKEVPSSQPRGVQELGDWDSIGVGRLLLTNRKLLWKNEQRELDLFWPKTTAIHNWGINTLGIRYGSARYRFTLGSEAGIKWLSYAGAMAQKAAEQHGHKIVVAPH